MQLREWVEQLEAIAPTRYAEAWDNVGLLVGDPQQAVTKVLFTIDYTPAVASEAAREKVDCVVAYHPPIFEPLKRVRAGSVIFDAIRRGIAVYSPHTALDVAQGGTNDLLADALGICPESRAPLRLHQAKATQFKLVTFVPEKALETVSKALFDAGAGRIGNYTSCSFLTSGTGTFFGQEGTSPAVGESGKLERADEIRVETVVPINKIGDVVRALRLSHPYEEPAFDLNQLAAPPEGLGQGRIGDLDAPIDRQALFERLKQQLELSHLLIAGPTEGPVYRAAACAGSCGDMLDDAIAQKVDVYLTGEMRHHDALRAASAGVTVVCTLHSNSERAVLKRLKQKLGEKCPQVESILSRSDRDPFLIR